MTQQLINTGTFPNDATGDPAQTAFIKCNNNFGQLFGTSQGVTFGPPPVPPGGVAVTINAAVGSAALVVQQSGSVPGASFLAQAGAPVSLKLTDGQAGTTVWSVNVGINVAGEFEIINNTAGTTPLKISAAGVLTVTGQTVFGAATGGAQGAGTLNAQGLFINGVTVVPGSGSTASILALPTTSPSIVSSVRITSPAIVRNSIGNYTVTHNLGLTPYGVSATVLQSSGTVGVVTVFAPTSTQISFLALVAGSLSDAIGDIYLNFVF
jgi:hypothetical protein